MLWLRWFMCDIWFLLVLIFVKGFFVGSEVKLRLFLWIIGCIGFDVLDGEFLRLVFLLLLLLWIFMLLIVWFFLLLIFGWRGEDILVLGIGEVIMLMVVLVSLNVLLFNICVVCFFFVVWKVFFGECLGNVWIGFSFIGICVVVCSVMWLLILSFLWKDWEFWIMFWLL